MLVGNEVIEEISPSRRIIFCFGRFFRFQYLNGSSGYAESRSLADMTSDKSMVELTDIVKSYPRPGGETSVLRGVTGQIGAGESVAIIGPSGSGKSTLLQIVGALDQPTQGQVKVAGEDLGALSEFALARFRNRTLGFVFQNHYLLPQCTVLENILIPTLAIQDAEVRAQAQEQAGRWLKRVGLDHRIDYRPARLSGGECQRVAVVRALINRPQMILADEPTGALDRNSAETLSELLLELNSEEGVTLVVVTHSAALAGCMSRILELRDGKLTAAETSGA